MGAAALGAGTEAMVMDDSYRPFAAGALVAAVMAGGVGCLNAADTLSGLTWGGAVSALCDAKGDTGSVGTCGGYLEAIADAMALGNQINGHAACLTKVSPFGIRAAFKKYVTSHPEDPPKLPATELVARAISEAFPCQ